MGAVRNHFNHWCRFDIDYLSAFNSVALYSYKIIVYRDSKAIKGAGV